MSTETILYIIIAGITALLLALFQYLYKSKKRKLSLVFTLLRFITLFSILLLLINPKFEKITFYNEKPNLVIAVDNSESIRHLNQAENTNQLIESLKTNQDLLNKFDLEFYTFGNEFNSMDSISFEDSQSNIASVFTNLNQIYQNTNAPTVLITDGNQTYGTDFEFVSKNYGQSVFPVILGDTITYSDLKIQQLNVNRYAYLKNKFPVEIIAVYNGNSSVNSQLIVSAGNTVVHRENLSFSKQNNSRTINVTIPANRVGVSSYVARLSPLDSEKNIINNSKPFAVDVIDQKTNVAIVSNLSHPDIGALKKSIESNEQRSVSILNPNAYLDNKDDYQMVILYQPNATFQSVITALDEDNKNRFIITGQQTDWSFLNGIQSNYTQELTGQLENYQAVLNDNFGTFIINDLSFNDFPPLHSEFGSIEFNILYETVLFKQINKAVINEPLMATFENLGKREAVLFGQGIWRWRAQSYLNNQSFQEFDDFIGKVVQYIASNKRRSRLNVDYESFYNGKGNIVISAQSFNKNYEFDTKANLIITLKNKATDSTTKIPFVLKQNTYQVDLSNFPSGDYEFVVSVNNGELSHSGSIKVLEYNVEQQFLNANVTKLQEVATNSQGKAYFISNSNTLITDLINDSRFATIQKSNKNIVPLIDFKLLLALLALSLAIEWFLRKYNGLI